MVEIGKGLIVLSFQYTFSHNNQYLYSDGLQYMILLVLSKLDFVLGDADFCAPWCAASVYTRVLD